MAGITSTKKIKGQPHLLAYITPNEVEKLKALGGQETMTAEGIPAYPEFDNYGYSSQADFDAGDRSKSNDPNVQRDSTFETYRGNKNIGTDLGLMAKYGTPEQKKEANEALSRGQTYGYGPNQNVFEKMGTYNMNYKNAFVNRQIEKKNKALRDYLSKQLQLNPHMDVDEIMEGLAGSFDPNTNTFGKYDFTKGFQKGTTFDLSKYGATQLGPFGLSTTGVTGNPLGTKYLDQTPDFVSHPSQMPSTLGFIASKFSPINMNTLKSHFNRVNLLENIKKDGVTQAEIDDYYDRTMGRGDYNIFGPTGGGDGPQPYLPIDYNTGAALPVDDIAEEKTFDYRFGDEQKVGANVLRGYVADGGRISKASGGIMDTATGRKGFILGGIADAVGDALGSVADAAGKVLKSDIGKAAVLGLGGYYLGGGQMFGLRPSAPGFSFGNLGKSLFLKSGKDAFTLKNLDPLKVAGLLTLGGAAMGPAKVDQMPGGSDRGGKLLDSQGNEVLPSELRKEVVDAYKSGDADKIAAIQDYYKFLPGLNAVRLPDITPYLPYPSYATGGRVAAQEGGLMDLGGMEKDYRNTGGFVDIGAQEKADDVPARLSVNEFVMTADAVRNAGGGDIDKGAEVMENMMKNLENGGRVSEESQGNTGAQEMFSVSERIGEVI
jgi:hypothetical protein